MQSQATPPARTKNLTLVSRPSPHQWQVHSTDLANSETDAAETLLTRWPALQAMLDGDDTPVSDEEVTRMVIRGGRGEARGIVKKRNEAPYLFDCAFTQEYNLRLERERQLLQVRAENADLAARHRDVLDALQRQLDQARAENAQRAEHEQALNARIERVEQQTKIRMGQVSALAAAAANFAHNKDLVMRFIEAADRGDWPAVEALLAPDVILHDEANDVHSMAGVVHVLHRLRKIRELARNSANSIAAVIADDDLVALRWTSPSAPIQVLRLCSDQIAEVWCSASTHGH